MKIRVLIVEDSRLYQTYLRRVLEREPCLEVAGIAGTAQEARSMVVQLRPDVITLDLSLPDVAEFELLKYLLKNTDIPVIVVSSMPRACEEAVRLGAKDFIEKISDTARLSAEQFAMLLQMKIKMQARWPAGSARRRQRLQENRPSRADRLPAFDRDKTLIAIGASLGGTESTLEVLRELPEDMPGILVVQHMPVGFTKAYALRLDRSCRLKVSEARDGERIAPGKVLVAESGRHMKVVKGHDGYYVRCRGRDKVSGFCPSVDVLFSSVAETGARGIGVLMTGMGRDGVKGLLKMREKGFYTIGQDQESCAVFGMPQAAYQADALDELLNPVQIAERLIEKCKTMQL